MNTRRAFEFFLVYCAGILAALAYLGGNNLFATPLPDWTVALFVALIGVAVVYFSWEDN